MTARNSMRTILLLLLLALVFGSRLLSPAAQYSIQRQFTNDGLSRVAYAASAILFVGGGGLLFALNSRYRPTAK